MDANFLRCYINEHGSVIVGHVNLFPVGHILNGIWIACRGGTSVRGRFIITRLARAEEYFSQPGLPCRKENCKYLYFYEVRTD